MLHRLEGETDFGQRRVPQWPLPALCYLALLLVASIDWVTGPDFNLGPLYLAPVAILAWWGNARWAYVLAVSTVLVRTVTDPVGPKFSAHPLAYTWNFLLRTAFFTTVVWLLHALRQVRKGLEATVRERTAALRAEVLERQRAEDSLRELATKLSSAEGAERRRVAYDIHDAVGQTLALLKLNMETVVARTPIDEPDYTRLVDCVDLVGSLIAQTRTLTFDLHPAMLDDLGLLPTLRSYAEHLSKSVTAEVTVNEAGDAEPRRPLPGDLSAYLFRAVKELLNNAIKHGNAREIIITLHWPQESEQLRIVVDDDGCGFDPAAAREPRAGHGLGLFGINERLNSLGGRLHVESKPDQGARLILEVPVPAVKENRVPAEMVP